MRQYDLVEMFTRQCATREEAAAIEWGQDSLSYRALRQQTASIAQCLRRQGQGNIALYLDSCPTLVSTLLACLHTGHVFAPVNVSLPEQLAATMMQRIAPACIVTSARHVAKLEKIVALLPEPPKIVVWDEITPSLEPAPLSALEPPRFQDRCYIYFTSGSTGEPKAILGSYRGLSHFVQWQQHEFGISARHRVGQVTIPAFDPYLREVLLPLVAGAVLVMPAVRDLVLSDELLPWLNREEISVLHMVPTLFRQRLLQGDATQDGAPHPLSLEYLFLAGEQLRGQDLEQFYARYGEEQCQLVNLYGPTETTLAKVFRRVTPDDQALDVIPIGRPLDEQVKVHILDAQGEPCATSDSGEIVIETAMRSYGYLDQEEENRRCFRQSPPYYFTGDIGVSQPDGQLVCLGRKDNQIKVRGVRADLLGIERVVQQAPTVGQCVVQVIDSGLPSARLKAFIVSDKADGAQIFDFVGQRLHQALVPAEWELVDALPMLPNGKINRKALSNLSGVELRFDAYRGPQTPQEEKILAVWRQVLQQERIGMDDHFFHRGGHSLLLMSLKAEMEKAFAVAVEMAALFENLTPATQLEYAQTSAAQPPACRLEKVPQDLVGPVSVLQRNIILAHQFHRQNTSYNLTRVVEIDRSLDISILQQAVDSCVGQLAILRSVFDIDNGDVVTRVMPEVTIPVESASLANRQQLTMAQAAFVRPFILEQAPLMRVGLWSVADGSTFLALDIHHSIADGMSATQLLTMLLDSYQSLSLGASLPAPLPWQYHDYIGYNLQQQARLEADNLNYWQQELANLPEPLQLTPGQDRPLQFDGVGDTLYLDIESELLSELQQVASRQGCTLFVLLYAAYALTLHKLSGQDDIVIGVPVAGRDLPEIADVPGVFMRVLPVRAPYQSEMSFGDYLAAIQQQFAGAVAHQDFAFEHLVEAVKAPRSASRQPLFDTMFALHDAMSWQSESQGISAQEIHIAQRQVKADIVVDAYRNGGSLTLAFSHAVNMVDSSRIRQLADHMQTLLQRIPQFMPPQRVGTIDTLPPAERLQLVESFNQTAQPVDGAQTLIERFHLQVARDPEQQACRSQGLSLSYLALDQRANQLAYALLERLGRRPARVAIMVSPSVDLAVAILAVLKAGMTYVPLDPDFPDERLQYMIRNAGVELLLTDLPELAGKLSGETILDCRDKGITEYPTSLPVGVTYDPHQLAYVIYTSGSTGQPKGVMIENHSVVNFINGMERSLDFTADKTVLALTTFSFDIFVLEFFLPLLTGAQLVIASREQQQDMAALSALVRTESITTLQFTPSRMKMFLAFEPDLQCFSGVDEVLMGGEYVGFELVESIKRCCPARVFNMYGPTETTVWSAVCELTHAIQSTVGRPIDNTQLYVLDNAQQLCPMGTMGELYIAGDGLARGYHQLPDKTATAFVANPFRSGEKMYRTGDLAYWLPGGDLCVCGRQDNQVKVKGHRIELHEIEEVLTWYPAIRDAVCLVRERQIQGFSESYLCAFYLSESDIEEDLLRQHLRAHLPDYMVPEAWARLAEFPLTANGKADRRAFPAIESSKPQLQPVKTQTPTQQVIYQTWAEILPVSHIGLHDNFFDVGGNSFHVVLVQKALAEQGIDVMAIDILEHATICRLADWYDSQQSEIEMIPCAGIPFPSAPIDNDATAPEWDYRYAAGQSRQLDVLGEQLGVSRDILLTGLTVYALAAATELNRLDIYLGDGDAQCQLVTVDLSGVDSLPDFFERVGEAVAGMTVVALRQLLPPEKAGHCSVYIANDDRKAVKRNALFDLVFVYSWEDELMLSSAINNNSFSRADFSRVGAGLNELVTQFT